MRHFWTILIVLMAALGPACALGAATVYTDRASLEAAIGPHVTYTFETNDGFPAASAPIDSLGSIQVNTGSPSGGSAYIRNYPVGTTNQTLSGAISAGTSPLYLSFTNPEYAVGFDAFPNLVAVGVTVQFGGDNPSTATFTVDPNDDLAADASLFFGLTSTDEITSIEVYSVGDVKSRVYGGIDNLTVVPEPSEMGALGLLSALLLYRKRHRSISHKNATEDLPFGMRRAIVEPLDNRWLLSTAFSYTGAESLLVGSNTNISQSTNSQAEEAIAVDPVDPSKIFAFSNNDGNPMFAAYSTDAGATWTPTSLPSTTNWSDPSATFDPFGNLYVAYMDHLDAGNNGFFIMLAVSTDGGRIFGRAITESRG